MFWNFVRFDSIITSTVIVIFFVTFSDFFSGFVIDIDNGDSVLNLYFDRIGY